MQRSSLSRYSALLAGLALAACGAAPDPAACGDCGAPPAPPAPSTISLSGVVAAGAPLIGYVSIKDATGNTVTDYLDTNGGYSADISSLTPPYLLYASGTVGTKVYTLLSAATAEDQNRTVNVTPLTNLIVANTVGASPESFYNNPDFSKITATALGAQEEALAARLQPLLDAAGIAADFDLRNSAFTPDHTGIDAMLDVIVVTVDEVNDTATITNVLDSAQTITDDLTDSTDTTILSAGSVTVATLTEIQKLTEGTQGVALLHASNVTDAAQFEPAFADGLSFDGASKTDLLNLFVSTNPSSRLLVTKFIENTKVFSLNSMDLTATTPVAWVTFGGGSSAVKFTKTGASGQWQFAGNDRGVNVSLIAETFNRNSGVDYVLTPDVTDFSAMISGAPSNMQASDYFVVKGPGLPAAGLVLIQSAFNDTANAETFGKAGEGWGYGLTAVELAVAQVSDGSVYTFDWYRDAGADTAFGANGTILYTDLTVGTTDTLVASYDAVLTKRPPAPSETVYFPAIMAPISTDTAAFAGGTLAVGWALPEGSRSDVAWLDVAYADGTRSRDAEEILAETATSITLTVTLDTAKTVSSAGLYVATKDAFGRSIVAQRNMIAGGDTGGGATAAPVGQELIGSWSLVSHSLVPDFVPELTTPNFVFYADGTWAWMELGGQTPNGIERGTYTIDATSFSATITEDGIADPTVSPPVNNGGMGYVGDVVAWNYGLASDVLTVSTVIDTQPLTFTLVRTKTTGVLDLNGTFDLASDPDVMIFYPNGKYFNWCTSSSTILCDDIDIDNIEIGNYTVSGQTITMGAKDYDVGAYGFYNGLVIETQFTGGNATTGVAEITTSSVAAPLNNLTLYQIKDSNNPIVGAWHIGATADFDPLTSEVLVFYANGTYFQWTNNNNTTASCTGVTKREEIGTYTFDGSTLNITSHIQNGIGGFDAAGDCSQPAGAIAATLSSDGKTLTVTDYGMSATRVE